MRALDEVVMPSVVAAQLYTLRDYTRTPLDIARTFARVKKLGYDAVQCSALGPIDPKELDKILKGEGLVCCATHVPLDRLKNQTTAVIDEHLMWGCRYTAVGGFFQNTYTTQDWLDFAHLYSGVARKFAGSAIAVGYH